MPEGFEPVIHLSLTDEHPYAQAFVVIEAVASDTGRDRGRAIGKVAGPP